MIEIIIFIIALYIIYFLFYNNHDSFDYRKSMKERQKEIAKKYMNEGKKCKKM